MGFKMKKPSIIKGTAGHKKEVKDYQELQVNRNMEQNMPDGRSMSSPFQKNTDDKSEGPRKVPTPAFSKTSPAKKTPKGGKSKKQKVAELHEKHKGKPGWQEYVDATFGGETTFKDGKSITRKKATRSPNKKSVAGIVAKKVGQKAASNAAKKGTDAVAAKHGIESPNKASKSPMKFDAFQSEDKQRAKAIEKSQENMEKKA